MGKNPDLIEQEIRRKRESISQKVNDITNRGAEDAREISERVKGVFDKNTLNHAVEEHPLSTLMGALGIGVAMGVASGSAGASANGDRQRQDYSDYQQPKQSWLLESSVFSGLISSVEVAAADGVREMVKAWLAPPDDKAPRDGHRYA
jgi:hypothetical protein